MPAIPCPRRASAWPAAGPLLPFALAAATLAAALAPAPVRANDRDPRGTPVPAAACVEHGRSASFAGSAWSPDGYFFVGGAGQSLLLRCPLPVNAIDLSGTSNDNDISKIRVHYGDPDGLGSSNEVQLWLVKTTPASPTLKSYVCEWRSNVDGTGSTGATKACPHDLASGSYYHFDVFMSGNATRFFGVDFPQ